MGLMAAVLLALAALVSGSFIGWLVSSKIRQGRLNNSRATAQKIIADAREEAQALKKTVVLEAKDEWRKVSDPLEREIETSRRSLRSLEAKLMEREHQLDRKVDILDSKERSLIKTEQDLKHREENIKSEKGEVDAMVQQQRQLLESMAKMSQAEARKMLIDQQEESARQFAARKVRELKDDAIANGNR